MSRARSVDPRARQRFVVLQGGLSRASDAHAETSPDDVDWEDFARRLGFTPAPALPDDYEDRLAERIFGCEAPSLVAAALPAEPLALTPMREPARRSAIFVGLALAAAAAAALVWSNLEAPRDAAARNGTTPALEDRAASEEAPLTTEAPREDEITPAPHATAREDIESPSVTPEAPAPDPGARLATVAPRRARVAPPTNVLPAEPEPTTEDERASEPEPAPQTVDHDDEPELASTTLVAVSSLAPRARADEPNELVDAHEPLPASFYLARRAEPTWEFAPRGERWLGVAAAPSDPLAPRAVAVTAQLDVTRALARF